LKNDDGQPANNSEENNHQANDDDNVNNTQGIFNRLFQNIFNAFVS
jgi:hypothetical protein